MRTMRTGALLLALTGVAVGCAATEDDNSVTDEALEVSPASSAKTLKKRVASAAPMVPAASTPHLQYQGGPVIPAVQLYAVYWTSRAQYQSHLNSFYQNIVQSPYFDWLSEYNAGGQRIGHGAFGRAYVINPHNTAQRLTDADVQRELSAQMSAGVLPHADGKNTLFMIHFPSGVKITLDDAQSCVAFCAYHNSYTDHGKNVYYGVHPDQESGGCENGCASAEGEDAITTVASHELIEAVTDPNVGSNDLAWMDFQNGEIGDICVGQAGTVNGYAVQLEWSNAKRRCIAR